MQTTRSRDPWLLGLVIGLFVVLLVTTALYGSPSIR